jgi:heptosyltransferase III
MMTSFAKPLRYRLDRWIRGMVMRVIKWCTRDRQSANFDAPSAKIRKILLVRANFRMGNVVLALPSVAAFREKFRDAQIDFVGSPVSSVLFQNQPLNHHYVAPRRFPGVIWQYPLLLRRLRANRYDLAVDVSCSQSGLGSFIVGLSGARTRIGLAGKWDQLFNLKIPKLPSNNKYQKLTEFLAALRLEKTAPVGALQFSATEKIEALNKLESVTGKQLQKSVGVFVGGRRLRGKRWPLENFVEVINGLARSGVDVVAFLGPEENDLAAALRNSLAPTIPILCEPAIRKFAAVVAHLDLFVCCDSGPMHLACAVGVPVLAIFQERDVARWAPPTTAARVVSSADGVGAKEVLSAALSELSLRFTPELPGARVALPTLG